MNKKLGKCSDPYIKIFISVLPDQSKTSKTIEKSRLVDAEINLIQVAVIKKDLAKVKVMLRHPVMMFFTTLKWFPHKKLYYTNFILYLVFLISFHLHGIYWIDYLQCLTKQSELKIANQTSCDGELKKIARNEKILL